MTEALSINGVSLDTYAYMATNVSALLTVPARRGENVVVPGRHGQIKTPNKRFDANEIVLPLILVGASPNGTIPSGSTEQAQFFARRDELLRLIYADDAVLAWTPDVANVDPIETRVEVVDVLDFTRSYVEPLAKVSVALTLIDAFWRDTADVTTAIEGESGTTVELTEFVGATAPMTDLQVTFHGPVNNPKLTFGERWVQYNGVLTLDQELVLDCGTWTASPGVGDPWSPDPRQVLRGRGPSWLEIDPAVTPFEIEFTHTGGGSATAQLAGRRKYLAA